MNSTTSRPKKSSSSKARRKPERGCGRRTSRSTSPRGGSSVPANRRRDQTKRLVSSLAPPAAAGRSDTTSLRQKFRAWQASLLTALERDTLLVPEWVAESVVQEAERFLKADLPVNFTERLAAKAHHLYPRHEHFRKGLNRRGNGGRQTLYMYMRHWTAGWLKRERSALYQKLPWTYAQGRPLT